MKTLLRRVGAFGSADRGSAMFSVLAITTIAATLTTAAMTAASGTLRRSDRSEAREQALHLAEAAVARGVTALAADPGYQTTAIQPPNPVTRAWVIGQGATAPLEQAREGEYAWIVPDGADVVFGLGYVPSRANATETRVLRVSAFPERPLNDFDILMQGSLNVSGNPEVTGGIHTNGDLTISGNPTIGGDATAVGAISISGNPTIAGETGGGFDPVSIPAVDPRAYRHLADYDLCPDATVRTILGDSPCTGTLVGTGLGNGWNGWKLSSGKWEISGNNAFHAAFYVYRANVKISGNLAPWSTTVLVEGLTVAGVLTNGDLEVSGNLEVVGDIVVEGSALAIAFMTSRDIKISGNGEFQGLIHAGEQFDMSGNPLVAGQVLASGTTNSPGSPISQNKISGNPEISGGFAAPQQAANVTTAEWGEL